MAPGGFSALKLRNVAQIGQQISPGDTERQEPKNKEASS